MSSQQQQLLQQDLISANHVNTYKENYHLKYNEIINSIAVNKEGNFVCLGGKKALQIVDLDTLKNVKCFIQQSKWEVGVVDWNTQAPNLIASSSNHDASIWDINNKYPLLNQFVSHQRPIGDLSWSLFDKDILATTSADSFVNLWDLRSPKRVMKLKALNSHILSGIQVKWNKFNSHVLASAHESNLMIWDLRKETTELNTTVHTTKVYGIDWSPHDPFEILTCSQDKSVKIWSYPNLQPKSIISTSHPVLRAKYLPIGKGVVTVSDRGENCIRMWNLNDLSMPVTTLIGHTDCVRSFDFRVKNTPGDKDIQIVSWSKDQNLRLWKLENNVKAACGIDYIPTVAVSASASRTPNIPHSESNNSLAGQLADIAMSTGSGSTSSQLPSSSSSSSGQQPNNNAQLSATNQISSSNGLSIHADKEAIESSYSILKQQDEQQLGSMHDEFIGPKELEYELKIIQNKFIDKSLKIEQVNLAQRVCIVSCTVSNKSKSLLNTSNSSNSSGSNSMNSSTNSLSNSTEDDTFLQDSLSITSVQLRVTFPTLYPQKALPRFECISNACTTSLTTNISIIQSLNEVAGSRAGKPCLEQCLLKLVLLVKKDVMDRARGILPPLSPAGIVGRNRDIYDPNIMVPPGGMEDSFIMGESSGLDPFPNLLHLHNNNNNNNNNNIPIPSNSTTTSTSTSTPSLSSSASKHSRPLSINGLQDILIHDYTQNSSYSQNNNNNNNQNNVNSLNNSNFNNNNNSSNGSKDNSGFLSSNNSSNSGTISSPRTISVSNNNNNNKYTNSPITNIPSSTSTSDRNQINSMSLLSKSFEKQQQLIQQLEAKVNERERSPLSGSFKESSTWAAASSSTLPADFSLSLHRNSLSISLTAQQQRQMETIPCPRLCGAVFGGNNRLICFWNNIGKGPLINQSAPRTYKDLLGIVNKPISGSASSNNLLASASISGISMANNFTSSNSPIYDSPLGMNHPMLYASSESKSMQIFGSSPPSSALSPLAASQTSQSSSNVNIRQHIPSINYQIKVLETSPLSPISLYLAQNYIINGEIEEICKHNEMVAKSVNRKDLVKLWSVLGMITDMRLFFGANGKMQQAKRAKQDSFEESWAQHPMGRPFVLSLFSHYIKINDIQTISMIYGLLTLSAQKLTQNSRIDSQQYQQDRDSGTKSPHMLSPSHSNSNLISQIGLGLSFSNLTQGSINFDEFLPKVSNHHGHGHTHSHSYSHSHSVGGSMFSSTWYDPSYCLLTQSHIRTYDQYLNIYSDILLRWDLLDKRAELMKFVSNQHAMDQHPSLAAPKPIQFQITCLKCQRHLVDNFCVSCKIFAFRCAICHISVRGLSSFCVHCGHGGHTEHMKSWFKKHSVCPTGCKCECSMSNFSSSSPLNSSDLRNPNTLLPDPMTNTLSSSILIDTHFSP